MKPTRALIRKKLGVPIPPFAALLTSDFTTAFYFLENPHRKTKYNLRTISSP